MVLVEELRSVKRHVRQTQLVVSLCGVFARASNYSSRLRRALKMTPRSWPRQLEGQTLLGFSGSGASSCRRRAADERSFSEIIKSANASAACVRSNWPSCQVELKWPNYAVSWLHPFPLCWCGTSECAVRPHTHDKYY